MGYINKSDLTKISLSNDSGFDRDTNFDLNLIISQAEETLKEQKLCVFNEISCLLNDNNKSNSVDNELIENCDKILKSEVCNQIYEEQNSSKLDIQSNQPCRKRPHTFELLLTRISKRFKSKAKNDDVMQRVNSNIQPTEIKIYNPRVIAETSV